MTPQYVLDTFTYENIIMYSKAAPSYDSSKEEDRKLDMNDPNTMKNQPDEIFF